MDKLGTKIPTLVFFLGVVYFASDGYGVVDAIVRAFMVAFGVALIILLFTMLLMFFLTLQKNRSETVKIPAADQHAQTVQLQSKKVEMQS